MDFYTAKALLEWQVELGADEAICDQPINRYELSETAPKIAAAESPKKEPVKESPIVQAPPIDTVAVADQLAAKAQNLSE